MRYRFSLPLTEIRAFSAKSLKMHQSLIESDRKTAGDQAGRMTCVPETGAARLSGAAIQSAAVAVAGSRLHPS